MTDIREKINKLNAYVTKIRENNYSPRLASLYADVINTISLVEGLPGFPLPDELNCLLSKMLNTTIKYYKREMELAGVNSIECEVHKIDIPYPERFELRVFTQDYSLRKEILDLLSTFGAEHVWYWYQKNTTSNSFIGWMILLKKGFLYCRNLRSNDNLLNSSFFDLENFDKLSSFDELGSPYYEDKIFLRRMKKDIKKRGLKLKSAYN